MQSDNHFAMKGQDVCKVYLLSPAHDKTSKKSLQENKTTLSNLSTNKRLLSSHQILFSSYKVSEVKENKIFFLLLDYIIANA